MLLLLLTHQHEIQMLSPVLTERLPAYSVLTMAVPLLPPLQWSANSAGVDTTKLACQNVKSLVPATVAR